MFVPAQVGLSPRFGKGVYRRGCHGQERRLSGLCSLKSPKYVSIRNIDGVIEITEHRPDNCS